MGVYKGIKLILILLAETLNNGDSRTCPRVLANPSRGYGR
jgi:hypothetical protein